MTVTRLLATNDAAALRELAHRNRSAFAPWQPLRPERYFTAEGHQDAVDYALRQHEAGVSLPLVILDADGLVAGTMTLQSIIRGFFQSCSIGYWLGEHAQGHGLATMAVKEAAQIAFDGLNLHRIQAETLPENLASQRVLERAGFVHYGTAPTYMEINGRWQDNMLFQLITPTPERVATG